MRVIRLAGWSGAGKSTLIVKLIPYLRENGFPRRLSSTRIMRSMSISRVRIPICIVRLVLARRFALMHELREAAEPRLAVLLGCMAPVDLILVISVIPMQRLKSTA